MKHAKRITKKRSTPHEDVTIKSVFKSVFLALPIAVAIGLLLLLPITALLLRSKDPNAYHTAAGLALLYLVTLLGGIIAARLHQRRAPFFCGLAIATVMLLVLLLLSLVLPSSTHNYTPALRVGQHALLFPAALAGTFLGAKEQKIKRHRTR